MEQEQAAEAERIRRNNEAHISRIRSEAKTDLTQYLNISEEQARKIALVPHKKIIRNASLNY